MAGPLRGERGQKADEWNRKVLRGLQGAQRGALGLRLRLSDDTVLRGLLEDSPGRGAVEVLRVAVGRLFIQGVQRQSRIGDLIPGNLSLQ